MARSSFRTKMAGALLCDVVLVGLTAAAYRLVDGDSLPPLQAVYLAQIVVLGAGGPSVANAGAGTLVVTMVTLIAGFGLRVYVFAAVTAHVIANLLQADRAPSGHASGLPGGSKPFRLIGQRLGSRN